MRASMRAVRLSRFGDPDVLEVVELPVPAAGAGEVLVRTRAAGVNFFEVLMRRDRYAVTPELPMMLGVEAAGIVEAVGEGVVSPGPGTRVAVPLFAAGRAGGYADWVTAPAELAVPLPDGLSFEDAAALMVQGLTALHLVRRSPPAGRSILVTAAAGGVGSLLVQLARQAGAGRIVAAAGSPAKRETALDLGADEAVDYTRADWPERVREATGGAGVDIVYDTVGGDVTRPGLEALAPRGELVFGALGRFGLGREDLDRMFSANQSLKGFALLPLLAASDVRKDLADLFGRAAGGSLKVLQGGRFGLDRAADAHRALETRQAAGKVVLVP